MFHDVGYAAREGGKPAREGKPAEAGFAPPFERHAAAGARLLLRQRGFHEAKINRALATLQHHKDYDQGAGPPVLFARILRIAEDYDAMLRRAGGGMSPPQALKHLAAYAGERYDPVLVQLLVNTLGRYPPGSLLQLEDGRIVTVTSIVRSPFSFDLPLCAVVAQADGSRPTERINVDLTKEGVVVRALGGRGAPPSTADTTPEA
jgi:hypothetical protein